jgi:hypothetical protein
MVFGVLWFILLLLPAGLVSQVHWQTFYERSGGLETPRFEETLLFSRMLADSSDRVTLLEYGTSAMGRPLFALALDSEGLSDPEQIRASGRVIFFILACLHPGEPDGKDAGLLFFRDVAIGRKHRELLRNVSYIFIPIANADGHERFGPHNRINQNGPKEMGWRTTATNLNMNRDFLKLDAPETASLAELFHHWMPDFFMDIHTTNGGDYQYVVTYAVEDFGNIDAGLTEWLRGQYMPAVEAQMEESGFPLFPYVSFRQWHDPRSGLRTPVSTPRFSVGYAGTRNRPGILVETHMLKPYSQRVEGSLQLIIHTAATLNRDNALLRDLNAKADLHCRSGALRSNPFPLTWRLTEESIPVQLHGYRYRVETSDLTGLERVIYSDTPEVHTLNWYRFSEPEKSVDLPSYYVIPAQWNDIITRLGQHGVQMKTLARDTTMELHTWLFSDVQFATTPFEGRHRVAQFNQEQVTRTFSLSKGSVIIPTDQPAARLIAHALEPASPESFLQWGFFNAIFERKEYAEAYVMDRIARAMIEDNPSLTEDFRRFKETVPDGPMKMWELYNWFYSRSPWWDPWKDVSRPGEFHPQPLTEPYVTVSRHTARAVHDK